MAESNDFDLYGDLYDEEDVKPDTKPIITSPPTTSTTLIPEQSSSTSTSQSQPTTQAPLPVHYDPGFGGKPAILGITKPNDMPEEG